MNGTTVSNAFHIAGVTNTAGTYCVTLDPSVDASTATATASVNYASDSTQIGTTTWNKAFAEIQWPSGCSGNAIEVQTFKLALSGGAETLTSTGQAFTLVVG